MNGSIKLVATTETLHSAIHSNAVITAIGTYVPERILTNAGLEKMVETKTTPIVRPAFFLETTQAHS
ncbi:hypothetical protein L1N85_08965 [Paenibacillus alkaliterrae]|uniref:hypothetical protein n=1 Tax=Paenibacillus alkaliterrae TaxID=320909 RepID=UPI001F1BE17A|nr:hypothetical protein [Paenibacillus alkaliterrae]MCF2938565.1 hypothetical protein [Paenibacillus alkaliterrae]